jgi:glycosyltransferase involved in cell wall biosynthesis
MKRKLIFISGANILNGGPLQIYNDILKSLSINFPNAIIIAIVGNKELFLKHNNVKYLEIKKYKSFFLYKFYYEYINYYFISKKFDIDLWMSLNDCSPSVIAKNRVVYCHNATPFYKRTLKDYMYPSRAFLQSFYYLLFYKINIHKNTFVIVQQQWIKEFINKCLNVPTSKIIINRPKNIEVFNDYLFDNKLSNTYTFIYPTKAEPYKNIEILFKAVEILRSKQSIDFKVLLTIDKNDNRYANKLYLKYGYLNEINWIGFVSRSELEAFYSQSNCLIFCSKLETWGLPITEFKKYNRPILVVDLPYARETIGNYFFANFFNESNPITLYKLMNDALENRIVFDNNFTHNLNENYVLGFKNLFELIFTYKQ